MHLRIAAVVAALSLPVTAGADTIGLITTASATVTLPSTAVSAGPYPFSALGVQASAAFSPGPIDVSVGGGTTFTLPTIAQGTVFNANDSLAFGYSPFWTGTVRATSGLSASADLKWDIGPFSGSTIIIKEQVDATASGRAAFGGALQGGSATDTDYTTKYGLSFNFLNPFPIFAEASLGATVQGHLTQGLTWAPTAEYGFWSWTDTDGIYDAGDVLSWHGVTSGALEYSFAGLTAPASSFFLNFIPGVLLDMPIGFDATFGLDVGGFAQAKVFGVTVAQATFPLGTASWQLANTSYLFNPFWYASETFSIPLTGNCTTNPFTGEQTCTGYRVPAQTSKLSQGGPLGGGPSGMPFMPAPGFLPSPGLTDAIAGGFCVNGDCYPGIEDDRLGDPDTPPEVDISIRPVPEPATLLLFGVGLCGLSARLRRRRPR